MTTPKSATGRVPYLSAHIPTMGWVAPHTMFCKATARERYWFETLQAKLNIFRPHLLMSDKVKMLQQKNSF
jgi:hypothetical protein